MYLRGIRGAISVAENTKEAITAETTELLQAVIKTNKIKTEDIASIFFSVTTDLDAEFPAAAARKMGYTDVPLLCLTEIPVPGSLPSCLRVLVHVNTEKSQKEMRHIYLKEAIKLRPDKA